MISDTPQQVSCLIRDGISTRSKSGWDMLILKPRQISIRISAMPREYPWQRIWKIRLPYQDRRYRGTLEGVWRRRLGINYEIIKGTELPCLFVVNAGGNNVLSLGSTIDYILLTEGKY